LKRRRWKATGSPRPTGPGSANRRRGSATGCRLVCDDLYLTNPTFIRRGIAEKTSSAVLIKINQIGTVTETAAAIGLCREAAAVFVNPFAAPRLPFAAAR
jgi:hypothetical protein